MPVEGPRGHVGAVPHDPRIPPRGDAAPAGRVRRTGASVPVDGFGGIPGARAEGPRILGPYAKFAAGGDFSRTVLTPSGEIFVAVRVSKQDPGHERPMVFLDGLAALRGRGEEMADKFRDEGQRTVISILLKGQGDTLLRDLEKTGGESLDHDITDSEQAKVVTDVLDALGIDAPVDVFGLSYGGAIAAAVARDAPDRVANALLVAPHVRSQARTTMGEAAWQMAVNNPWNPFGLSMYRSAAKATLGQAFGQRKIFEDHPGAFHDALFRLAMGIDKNELEETVEGVKDVHVLVAEDDGASPLKFNRAAAEAAEGGHLTVAPDEMKGQHDLVSANPDFLVRWVNQTLTPDRVLEAPRGQDG